LFKVTLFQARPHARLALCALILGLGTSFIVATALWGQLPPAFEHSHDTLARHEGELFQIAHSRCEGVRWVVVQQRLTGLTDIDPSIWTPANDGWEVDRLYEGIDIDLLRRLGERFPNVQSIKDTGWPFLAFHTEFEQREDLPQPRIDLHGAVLIPAGTVPFVSRSFGLPFRPIWTGLLGDTLAYATVWAAAAIGARAWRHTRRRRRGFCPACGYDLRYNIAAGCPECGWNRKATSATPASMGPPA
jgi:hypothetical protein